MEEAEQGGSNLEKDASSSLEQDGVSGFHHSATSLPVLSRHMEVDSESDVEASGLDNHTPEEWQLIKSARLIDEFTDVNEGEKAMMKMWNCHMMKCKGLTGDCHVPLICNLFVENYGDEILKKNLYHNCCLHLTNLYEFGLLTFQGVHATVQLLNSKRQPEKLDAEKNVMEAGAGKLERKHETNGSVNGSGLNLNPSVSSVSGHASGKGTIYGSGSSLVKGSSAGGTPKQGRR